MQLAQERGRAFYLRQYQRYQQAYEYLAQQEGFSLNRTMLQEAVRHLSVRGTLPTPRVQRLVPIVRELYLRRYARYSNGMLTALRDLLV